MSGIFGEGRMSDNRKPSDLPRRVDSDNPGDLPQRKPNRLRGFDYSQSGAYFVTICVKDRKNILGRVVGGDAHIAPHTRLSEFGAVVEKHLQSIPGMDKYVVMPNHVHMIIIIDEGRGAMRASPPTQSIPQRIKSFKTLVTKNLGRAIWQRSYHDHVIRDQGDYLKIWEYIGANAQHWEEDCFYTA